ncbi:CBS domain-containing protein [Candidatus Nanohalococcus occultus]|uniref:Protein containing two CBS domains (Some fused to C-terminal double-stranded RNA-binding domain of RaiA family) n=1 Tax=Candidatus Nanohalococcus occultus TaxID=2978047 RepID=A0ABY8CHR8_9ARCH|nr:Protein containing two CBS domains (some fused to C-terminal double-stranded RNA-binding domain of RaiA family) [Candidatus Nanohaloarchaeota archaeon SVXNc]
MKSASELSASEVMEKDFIAAEEDSSLASIKNTMEENDLRAIPVVDEKNNLEGAIGYRDLVRQIQFNPDSAKIEKVMHQPPEFEAEDSLIELAELRINSGRKLMVHTEGNKLKGVISDLEFLNAFKGLDQFDDVTTMDLGPIELVTTFEEDSIEEARHKMLDNNVSRLPVLDKDGNLTGIVTSTDMLKVLIPRESPDSGGTKGGRTGGEVFIAGGDEKDSLNDITVNEIMNRMVTTSEGHISGDEAIEKMAENDTREMLVVDGNYPQTIVTVKDFIDYLSEFAEDETVLVSLVGLDVAEEKAAVHQKVRKQIRGSLGRKLDRPEELKLRFKKAEKDGKKHRYEVSVQLVTDDYVINVDEEDWDLLDVVDQALSELDTLVKKETGRD